jgi:hypothetical protein
MSALSEKVSDHLVQVLAKEEWKRANGQDYERCAVDVPQEIGNDIGVEIVKLAEREGLRDFRDEIIWLAGKALEIKRLDAWPKPNFTKDEEEEEIEWRMAKAWHVATPSERFLANLLVMVWRQEMVLAGVVEKIADPKAKAEVQDVIDETTYALKLGNEEVADHVYELARPEYDMNHDRDKERAKWKGAA